jgi:hypothetical protein
MTNLSSLLAIASIMTIAIATSTVAQNTPAPGPANPVQPNPQAQPGATIVLNPTMEECRRGWDASMKWTREQYDDFCAKLRASK